MVEWVLLIGCLTDLTPAERLCDSMGAGHLQLALQVTPHLTAMVPSFNIL
jgi:hypothetical protein